MTPLCCIAHPLNPDDQGRTNAVNHNDNSPTPTTYRPA